MNNKIPMLFIDAIKNNKPLIAKLMQAEAKKHDCSIRYDPETDNIIFKGAKEKKECIVTNSLSMLCDCENHKKEKKKHKKISRYECSVDHFFD